MPPQYLPIPPAILALACETVTRQVSRLPFLRSGITVTEELVGVTLESLNAEPTRTLPLTTPREVPVPYADGLDIILEQRLKIPSKPVVPVIADVLTSAGITEPVPFLDRTLHSSRKALRLLPQWTWHIASTPPPEVSHAGAAGLSSTAWLNLCPVCRGGILTKVVGKQLFGVPRTDFIIECSTCGAKFIPVGTGFRLVSIAVIRDPLWKKYLDQTFTPQQWADIASPSRIRSPPRPASSPEKSPVGSGSTRVSGSLPPLKNGSLAVPVEGRTLFFRPAGFRVSGGVKEGVFGRLQPTLEELLKDPAYAGLNETVLARYSRYLPLKTGLFISQLRERHDLFYREFLNPYGDEKFGTLRAEESPDIDKPGVLLVVAGNSIYFACSCPVSFRSAINDTFGRITADLCYLNGDPTRCRINAVLCSGKKDVGLFTHACSDPAERERLAALLAVGDPVLQDAPR